MDIFNTMQEDKSKHKQAVQNFDRHMKEAVRLLMQRKEGRTFLRWLGMGQSAQSILQLIMDYQEENHV